MKIPRSIFDFALVGGIGFCVDAGLMVLLTTITLLSPFEARLISIPTAVTVTWLLNRNWTFGKKLDKVSHKRYPGYVLVQAIGALINYGVFMGVLLFITALSAYPIIALAIGSLTSMGFTYTASQRLIFHRQAVHKTPI